MKYIRLVQIWCPYSEMPVRSRSGNHFCGITTIFGDKDCNIVVRVPELEKSGL